MLVGLVDGPVPDTKSSLPVVMLPLPSAVKDPSSRNGPFPLVNPYAWPVNAYAYCPCRLALVNLPVIGGLLPLLLLPQATPNASSPMIPLSISARLKGFAPW